MLDALHLPIDEQALRRWNPPASVAIRGRVRGLSMTTEAIVPTGPAHSQPFFTPPAVIPYRRRHELAM
jgi:hypothetical protein